jgi:1-phosphofructokinase family hexose kinase
MINDGRIRKDMFLAVCPNPSVDTFIWLESLEPGKVHRAMKEERFPGGKGVHVALAAAELGEPVVLLGFWGSETGSWIKKECRKRNIECIGPELNDWTRTCITFKSDGVYDDTELLGCGPSISSEDYSAFTRLFEKYIKQAGVVTLSGSWPSGAPSYGYAELIRTAKTEEVPVFLDATGDHFKAGLDEQPFAIHLNLNEARFFTQMYDIEQIIGYFKKYVKLAAITAGKDGLYMNMEDKILHGKVELDKIYSAVGSGDCLTAGLAIGLLHEMDTDEMLVLGVACGGANCLRPDLGMLYQHDVKKLLKEVEVFFK